MAAFLFTLELYGIITVSSVFLQILFLGTEGWDMPIQCIKILAAAPWNVLQAEIYEYIYLCWQHLDIQALFCCVQRLQNPIIYLS